MPRKKYYQAHKQRCREINQTSYQKRKEHVRKVIKQYQRQHRLIINGKYYYGLNKRPRPDDICELCGRKIGRLDYHHWNGANPSMGIWVCLSCHRMCEGIDRGLAEIYTRLKLQIEDAFKEEE